MEVEGASTFTTSKGIAVHNCIPLDPFYLAWKAREYGSSTKFIELAGEVNVRMPEYVVGKLQSALNARGLAVKGAKVLVLGLAYKKDIDDTRESPAFEIIELLADLGAAISVHDPHVPVIPETRRHPELAGQASLPLTPDVLAAHDAVVIVTDHSAVDYELVHEHARSGRGHPRGDSPARRKGRQSVNSPPDGDGLPTEHHCRISCQECPALLPRRHWKPLGCARDART